MYMPGEAGADDDGVDARRSRCLRPCSVSSCLVRSRCSVSATPTAGCLAWATVQARTALTTCWKPRSLPGSSRSVKKPWVWPSWRRKSTGTPASRSAVGVGLALVAQDVVLGGEHDRRRQAGQRRGPQRRGVGLGALGGVGHVVVPEPHHRVAGQQQLVRPGRRRTAGRSRRRSPGRSAPAGRSPGRRGRGPAAPSPRRGSRRRCRRRRSAARRRRRRCRRGGRRSTRARRSSRRRPSGSGARAPGGSRRARPRTTSARRACGPSCRTRRSCR